MNPDINKLFEPYITAIDGAECYLAGLPSYPRNFSRDALIAGIIADDAHLIHNQLLMSLKHQGRRTDALTGEEPGKIHHEYPGVIVRSPYVSTYNGCDTTALYLIGLEALWQLDKKRAINFAREYKSSIETAIQHIENHTAEDIFWDFPPRGATRFSLRATYWKDSILPNPNGQDEPTYPVAFALVQFQVARALLSASKLLNREDLAHQADCMFKAGISAFITVNDFFILHEKQGRLKQASSDELHCLAFIPRQYGVLLPFEAICTRASLLVTPVGIACTTRDIGTKLTDKYHGYVVWIFEQALLDYGCQKFGLSDLSQITQCCIRHIGEGQELLAILPSIKPLGNNKQLWSAAAKIYFSEMPSLRNKIWL